MIDQCWSFCDKHFGSLLDIGSGDGAIPKCVDASCKISLDLASHLASQSCGVRADALHVPFAPGTMDNVWAFDILEHLPDDALFRSGQFPS